MHACSPITGNCDFDSPDLLALLGPTIGGVIQIIILGFILVWKERGDLQRLLQPSFENVRWVVDSPVVEMVPIRDDSVARERERILNGCDDDILFVKLWHTYPRIPSGWQRLFWWKSMPDPENPLVPDIKWVVRDLTLGVRRNEVLGVIGENGAGKSTAISIMLGVVQQVGGYAGITQDRRIGFCPQVNALWGKISGIEHVRFYSMIRGVWNGYDSAAKLLESVGLVKKSHYQKTKEYSGGMKRRLCLAIALIGDPSVLILDEPTAGVDIAGKREIWTIIKRMCSRNCSALITTHSLEEADNLSNRIGVMDHGRLVKMGTTNELKKQQKKFFISIIETPEKRGNLGGIGPGTPSGLDGILRASLSGMAVKRVLESDTTQQRKYEIDLEYVKLSEIVTLLIELRDTRMISNFTISQLSLEDVFLNTVGKLKRDSHQGGNGIE